VPPCIVSPIVKMAANSRFVVRMVELPLVEKRIGAALAGPVVRAKPAVPRSVSSLAAGERLHATAQFASRPIRIRESSAVTGSTDAANCQQGAA
jgi:hypothetical protein